MWEEILVLFGSLVFGAIPFSQLFAYGAGIGDLRQIGSYNPGVANLYRMTGRRYAIPAAILDNAKGMLPVLFSQWLGLSPWIGVAGGLLGMIGHNYSPFLGFRGGKGLAAGAGMLIALSPIPALLSLLLAGVVYRFLLHWVPGSAFVMVLSFLLYALLGRQPVYVIVAPLALGLVSFISWFPGVVNDPIKRVPPKLRNDGSSY